MTEEYIGEPGLREKIIAIICEEWPDPDKEIGADTIFERLQSEGGEASEQVVRDVLLQLADHGDIDLVIATEPPTTYMTIHGVRQELCE
jgi:Fe2+ or Zn2+ uptake regulation protein